MPKIGAVILAAGKGTRLRSQLPKVLHEAGGRSLLEHVMQAALGAGLNAGDMVVVAGYGADRVRERTESWNVRWVRQEPQLGTGHAVSQAREALAGYDTILVLHGDMPLLSAATVRALSARRQATSAAAVLATAIPDQPLAYGRILRDAAGRVLGIVEEKSATPEQHAIRELNAGFYAFQAAALWPALEKIGCDNPHREYYLTDVIALLARAGEPIATYSLPDADEIMGVNDRRELAEADLRLRRRKRLEMMDAGVTIYSPESVTIDPGVTIGCDTIIEAGAQILGACRIGDNCRVGAGSILRDCDLDDGVQIFPYSHCESAWVTRDARIGPFARLREGARVETGAHVGNFVELKKTRLGPGSKANHLAYLGDSTIGAGVNIGAGTITCNYDGQAKHPTEIGDGSFIGSNATLVAPLKIGADAYVGAGSVVTETVEAGALALGRARQVQKPGWSARKRSGRIKTHEAKAAARDSAGKS